MAYIQLSLYGRTSQELWYQETGLILEPSLNPFVAPAFQCLSLNGQMQEWCEGKNLSFAGESCTPNISQRPNLCKEEREYLLYAILEDIEPTKYYISPQSMHKDIKTVSDGTNQNPLSNRDDTTKTRRNIPNIRAFQERKMRTGAKQKDKTVFTNSFGKPNEPFPTLLTSNPQIIAYWYDGKEQDGYIRYLTPLEYERLMGLPKDWTKYSKDKTIIKDSARYKAIGNAIAVPCTDYIMAGIQEVFLKEKS